MMLANSSKMESNSLNLEFELLKSIYYDCEVIENDSESGQLHFTITLIPFNDSRKHYYVNVVLEFMCLSKYPHQLPIIKIKNSLNLSDKKLENLLTKLEKKAKEKIGEAMLHDLCDLVRTFLDENNHPPKMSCYEEMIKMNQEKLLKEQNEFQLKEREKCNQEIYEARRIELDFKERQLALKKNKKFLSKTQSLDPTEHLLKTFDLFSNDKLPNFEESSGSRLKDDFEIMNKIGEGGFGQVVKVQNKLDGRFYAIKCIILSSQNSKTTTKIIREVKLLSRLNHENVVRYYNSWVEKIMKTDSGSGISGEESERDSLPQSFNLYQNSEDSFIYFEEEEQNNENENLDPDFSEDLNKISKKSFSQVLYIQMEFCDKSTLKDCIETNLYQNSSLLWEMFREIVEGLLHIHDQGIIHRDLKPVNIFIDANNHVKIGDFGLATFASDFLEEYTVKPKIFDRGKENKSLTSNIGTALYASPEVINNITSYNQKVDIYSLGIIFFEMSYKRFETDMERCEVLSKLRSSQVLLPCDVNLFMKPAQEKILIWLLNHDPNLRPTTKELLSSDLFPPQAYDHLFLDKALVASVKNTNSHSHKKLLNTIFSQTTSAAIDHIFEHKIAKELNELVLHKRHLLQYAIRYKLEKIFINHGAVNWEPLLLMPHPTSLYPESLFPVKLMNQNGNLVMLPQDLKVPFARQVEKSNLEFLKRYCFSKVYKENILKECHPREEWRASFDIVAPVDEHMNFYFDFEVIMLSIEVLHSFRGTHDQGFQLIFNHYHLLSGIMVWSGISKEHHHEVMSILGIKGFDSKRKNIWNKLISLDLNEECVEKFLSVIQKEGSLSEIFCHMKKITNTRTQEATLVKQALKYLEKLISKLNLFSSKIQILVSLKLTDGFHLYSGMVFQISRIFDKRLDLVASGGVFSNLLQQFRQLGKVAPFNKHATGVSFYFNKLFPGNVEEIEDCFSYGAIRLLIVMYQQKQFFNKLFTLSQSLWEKRIQFVLFYKDISCFEQAKEFAKNHKIPFLLILDSDFSLYRIDEKEKLIFREETEESFIKSFFKNHFFKSVSFEDEVSRLPKKQVFQDDQVKKKTDYPRVQIKLVGSNQQYKNPEKILYSMKTALEKLTKNCFVHILVTDLEKHILKSLSGQLEVSMLNQNKDNFLCNSSFNSLFKEFPREKKYILKLSNELLKLDLTETSVIILYSSKDDFFKIIF